MKSVLDEEVVNKIITDAEVIVWNHSHYDRRKHGGDKVQALG